MVLGSVVAVGFAEIAACGDESSEPTIDAGDEGLRDGSPVTSAEEDALADVLASDAGADSHVDAASVPRTGLALWLAADIGFTATPTAGGTQVAYRWADQSANGRDATGTDPDGPKLGNTWPQRPGLPVLSFIGQSIGKRGPFLDVDLGFLSGDGGFTLFVVAGPHPSAPGAGGPIVSAGLVPAPFTCCGDEGRWLDVGFAGYYGPAAEVTGCPDGSPCAFVNRICGGASIPISPTAAFLTTSSYAPTTGLYSLVLNGQSASDDSSKPCARGARPTGTDAGGWIGRAPIGEELRASLAEIIGYERVLSAAERVATESYLRKKWGTP